MHDANNSKIYLLLNYTFIIGTYNRLDDHECYFQQVNDSTSLEDLTGLIHDSGLNPTAIQKVRHFYWESKSQGLTSDVGSLIRACRLTKMGMNSKINKNEVQSMKNAFLLTYVDGCHDIESKKVC